MRQLCFRFKEGCGVTLYIRDNSSNELGFYLYRRIPAHAFKRIARLVRTWGQVHDIKISICMGNFSIISRLSCPG